MILTCNFVKMLRRHCHGAVLTSHKLLNHFQPIQLAIYTTLASQSWKTVGSHS